MGMNRSKYLADFLMEKGYDTDCAGILIETKNSVTQKRVDDSDVLIFVLPRVQEKFLQHFRIEKQKIITLNVEDRLDILCPEKPNFTPVEAKEAYERLVYPKLRRQIAKYIPLLQSLS